MMEDKTMVVKKKGVISPKCQMILPGTSQLTEDPPGDFN